MELRIAEENLQEAANEAARIIFHGMHPFGVGHSDQSIDPTGFKAEMARIIVREMLARRTAWTEKNEDSKGD